jgi:hypothetical protein
VVLLLLGAICTVLTGWAGAVSYGWTTERRSQADVTWFGISGSVSRLLLKRPLLPEVSTPLEWPCAASSDWPARPTKASAHAGWGWHSITAYSNGDRPIWCYVLHAGWPFHALSSCRIETWEPTSGNRTVISTGSLREMLHTDSLPIIPL